MKVHVLPVFIRRDKLSDDDLDAAIIYRHIDGGNVLRREMVITIEFFRLAV